MEEHGNALSAVRAELDAAQEFAATEACGAAEAEGKVTELEGKVVELERKLSEEVVKGEAAVEEHENA